MIIKERIEMNIPRRNGNGIHAEKTPDWPDIGPIGISAKSIDALL